MSVDSNFRSHQPQWNCNNITIDQLEIHLNAPPGVVTIPKNALLYGSGGLAWVENQHIEDDHIHIGRLVICHSMTKLAKLNIYQKRTHNQIPPCLQLWCNPGYEDMAESQPSICEWIFEAKRIEVKVVQLKAYPWTSEYSGEPADAQKLSLSMRSMEHFPVEQFSLSVGRQQLESFGSHNLILKVDGNPTLSEANQLFEVNCVHSKHVVNHCLKPHDGGESINVLLKPSDDPELDVGPETMSAPQTVYKTGTHDPVLPTPDVANRLIGNRNLSLKIDVPSITLTSPEGLTMDITHSSENLRLPPCKRLQHNHDPRRVAPLVSAPEIVFKPRLDAKSSLQGLVVGTPQIALTSLDGATADISHSSVGLRPPCDKFQARASDIYKVDFPKTPPTIDQDCEKPHACSTVSGPLSTCTNSPAQVPSMNSKCLIGLQPGHPDNSLLDSAQVQRPPLFTDNIQQRQDKTCSPEGAFIAEKLSSLGTLLCRPLCLTPAPEDSHARCIGNHVASEYRHPPSLYGPPGMLSFMPQEPRIENVTTKPKQLVYLHSWPYEPDGDDLHTRQALAFRFSRRGKSFRSEP